MSHAALLTRRLVGHDPGVVDHAARVTDLALRLATELDAAPPLMRRLVVATPLHDIGKLDVDPAILAKPGPLDDDEFEAIRSHPVAGTRIITGIQSLRAALETVLHHHERWDGNGLSARAERHGDPGGRAHRRRRRRLRRHDLRPSVPRARSRHAEAVAEIERCAGTQFDPRVAEAFVRMVS